MDQTLTRLTETIEPHLARIADRFDAELASDLSCVGVLTKHVARFRGKMLRPTLAYLDMLDSAITRAIEAGGDAARALEYVPGDAYRDWRNFDPRHALNVGRAWRELEDRWMQSAPKV